MSGTERQIIHQAELIKPRERGRYLMSFCPIHGGDHQRSLHINLENGYGKCHACGVDVFCPELAPEGAPWPSQHKRAVTANDLLRPRRNIGEEVIADWQRRELQQLHKLYPRMQARLSDARCQDYLARRGIPLEVAQGAGVGYVPPDAKFRGPMQRWSDRLIFPLGSPAGDGFAGRSLWHFEIVKDEAEHKALLDSAQDAPERWLKTSPAGWFGYDQLQSRPATLVVVEGAMDRLALLAAGLLDVPVIALAGTAMRVEWLPRTVRNMVLALDRDTGGQQASKELWWQLMARGVAVHPVLWPDDELGKDVSARWRVAQWDGVAPVFDALDALQARPADQLVTDAPEQKRPAEDTRTASPEARETPWLDDQVIQYLLREGFEIIEAHLMTEVVPSMLW